MTVFRSLGMLTYLLAAAPVFAECDQAAVDPMIQNIQNLLEQERETLFQLSNCPDSGCSRSVIERWGAGFPERATSSRILPTRNAPSPT